MEMLADRVKKILESAPDGVIDASVKPLLNEWGDPPKAIEVLKVLDKCVHGGLASGMVITALNTLLRAALEAENTTFEDVAAKADWRF